MENQFLKLLIDNKTEEAAKLFATFEGEVDTNSEAVAAYIIDNDAKNIIDCFLNMLNVNSVDKFAIINNISFNLCKALSDAYDEESAGIAADCIFTLYTGVYEPLFKLFDEDKNEYVSAMISWHLEYGRYRYVFDENDTAIEQWETAKKLCKKFLSKDETLHAQLLLCYFNLGLAYQSIGDNDMARSNFEPYYMHKESQLFDAEDRNQVLADIAEASLKMASVCEFDEAEPYLMKANNIYRDFYFSNDSPFDRFENIEHYKTALGELIDHYEIGEEYVKMYPLLVKSYDFACKNLADDPDYINMMSNYIDAGYALCNYYIHNSELFEEYEDEDGELCEPIDENRCEEYLNEYFKKVNQLNDKYSDDENILPTGFAKANFLMGKYYFFEGELDKCSEYLFEVEAMYKEFMSQDPNNARYQDGLYETLDYIRDTYRMNDQLNMAIEIVEEMVKLREDIYATDTDDICFFEELMTAYSDAADFYEENDMDEEAAKYTEKYDELSEQEFDLEN